jgi:hypothetical protein
VAALAPLVDKGSMALLTLIGPRMVPSLAIRPLTLIFTSIKDAFDARLLGVFTAAIYSQHPMVLGTF